MRMKERGDWRIQIWKKKAKKEDSNLRTSVEIEKNKLEQVNEWESWE